MTFQLLKRRLQLLLVVLVAVGLLVWNDDKIVGSPRVDLDFSELSGRDSVLKEDIKFSCDIVSKCAT